MAQYAKADLACKSRAEGNEDIEAKSLIFAEQLAEFPADVIADAFRTWIKTEKFSPTVAEIRDLCWIEYRARFGLKELLKKMLNSQSENQDKRTVAKRADPGEVKKIMQELRRNMSINPE
jgi:hypothetical protein